VTNLDEKTAIKAISGLVLLVLFVGIFTSFASSQESLVGHAVKGLVNEKSELIIAEPIEQEFVFSCINGEEFIEEDGVLTATHNYCIINEDGLVERTLPIYPSE